MWYGSNWYFNENDATKLLLLMDLIYNFNHTGKIRFVHLHRKLPAGSPFRTCLQDQIQTEDMHAARMRLPIARFTFNFFNIVTTSWYTAVERQMLADEWWCMPVVWSPLDVLLNNAFRVPVFGFSALNDNFLHDVGNPFIFPKGWGRVSDYVHELGAERCAAVSQSQRKGKIYLLLGCGWRWFRQTYWKIKKDEKHVTYDVCGG